MVYNYLLLVVLFIHHPLWTYMKCYRQYCLIWIRVYQLFSCPWCGPCSIPLLSDCTITQTCLARQAVCRLNSHLILIHRTTNRFWIRDYQFFLISLLFTLGAVATPMWPHSQAYSYYLKHNILATPINSRRYSTTDTKSSNRHAKSNTCSDSGPPHPRLQWPAPANSYRPDRNLEGRLPNVGWALLPFFIDAVINSIVVGRAVPLSMPSKKKAPKKGKKEPKASKGKKGSKAPKAGKRHLV